MSEMITTPAHVEILFDPSGEVQSYPSDAFTADYIARAEPFTPIVLVHYRRALPALIIGEVGNDGRVYATAAKVDVSQITQRQLGVELPPDGTVSLALPLPDEVPPTTAENGPLPPSSEHTPRRQRRRLPRVLRRNRDGGQR